MAPTLVTQSGPGPKEGLLSRGGKKGPSPLSKAPYAHNNSQIRTQISSLFHAYQLGLIKNAACRHTHTSFHILKLCVNTKHLVTAEIHKKMQLIDIHIFQNHRPLRSTDGVHLTQAAQSKQHCVVSTPPEILFPPAHPFKKHCHSKQLTLLWVLSRSPQRHQLHICRWLRGGGRPEDMCWVAPSRSAQRLPGGIQLC